MGDNHKDVKIKDAMKMYPHREEQLTTELEMCQKLDTIRAKPAEINFPDIKPLDFD